MEISVTDAKAQLTELVRRAEAGDEIVLTRTVIRRTAGPGQETVDGKRAGRCWRSCVRLRSTPRPAPAPHAARISSMTEDGLPR